MAAELSSIAGLAILFMSSATTLGALDADHVNRPSHSGRVHLCPGALQQTAVGVVAACCWCRARLTTGVAACPVIAYVAEGEIRSQVEGQPETVYKTGDTFYEAPNGVHAVSANASQTKPAKLVAFFVCDHAAPLSAPAERTRK